MNAPSDDTVDERLVGAIEDFVERLPAMRGCPPAYAFFIGRLEPDFRHAREAVRAAVEWELGIACVWSDDGHRRFDTGNVRQTTQWLIQHAAVVLADLTLGPENPEHENPSRAHEIGVALAYGRPLMLSSREPRRYPYFSIGDLQMFFWAHEYDLWCQASEWLRGRRGRLGRRVLNAELSETRDAQRPAFVFEAARSYRWPENKPVGRVENGVVAAMAAAAVLVVSPDARPYAQAGLAALVSAWTAPLILAALQRSWGGRPAFSKGLAAAYAIGLGFALGHFVHAP